MSKALRNFFNSKGVRLFTTGVALFACIVIGGNIYEQATMSPGEKAHKTEVSQIMRGGHIEGRTFMFEYQDAAGVDHTLQVSIDADYKLDDESAAQRIALFDNPDMYHQGMGEQIEDQVRAALAQRLQGTQATPVELSSALYSTERALDYAFSPSGPEVPISNIDLTASITRGDIAHDGLRTIMSQQNKYVSPQLIDPAHVIDHPQMTIHDREQRLGESVVASTNALNNLADAIERVVTDTREAKPPYQSDLEYLDDSVSIGYLTKLEQLAQAIRTSAEIDENAPLADQASDAFSAYKGHIDTLGKTILGYKLSPADQRALAAPKVPSPGN